MRTSFAQLIWWVPALVLMVALWFLSGSGLTAAVWSPLEWLGRFAAYMALAYSLGRASGHSRRALIFAVWWGAGLEVRQAFMVGHHVGLADWWPALLGALVGARNCRIRQRTAVQRHTLEVSEPVAYEDAA